ncbi:MAG: SCO family protein [Flavobacteriaceae bacterium]
MINFFSRFKFFFAVLGVLSVIIVFLFYNALKPEERLPIYQPNMVSTTLVDSSMQYVRKYHSIADFKLVNQNGDTITQNTYAGKIYVADFFFTTCPSICPVMTANLAEVQDEFKDDNEVLLLSHSVTPEIDSVAQLKKYAIEKGVIDKKWNLVTGDKKQIYELARKSYMAVMNDGDGGAYDMIHTENFMLIDKERRIRGYYDGTNREEVQKLIRDIEILKSTYSN